jgi:hypothetical protein
MEMPFLLTSILIAAAIYGWVRLLLWALVEDRRGARIRTWMRELDAEIEYDLLHAAPGARWDELA